MKIDQETKLYGVMGSPVKHSLGPVMHNKAFSTLGMNAVYLAFDTKDVKGCIKGMKALGIDGMSVTIPHKTVVMDLLDEVEGTALKIGAVNTIVNKEGRLIGHNTDAYGSLKALEERTELSNKNCLIAGAGGAARAIGYVLADKVRSLAITNRSSKRGEELATFLGCTFVPLEKAGSIRADILIQTTPIGMYPNEEDSLFTSDELKEEMLIMDVIYNPIETKLLRVAREKGCAIITGLSMFVYQGAEQFKLWTGVDAPIREMTQVVTRALKPC